jgi:hypothetical protein
LTWTFQNFPEIETSLNRKLAQEGTSSILLGRDTKESNRLHKSWRRSRFCKDLDKLLSGGQRPHDDSRSESEDQESDGEESNEASKQADAQPTLPPSNSTRADIGSIHQKHSEPFSPNIVQTSSTATVLPADRWRLLDVFFSYTNSWLPICEKHDVLKTTYMYGEQGIMLSSVLENSGDHAELWSIFALASLQARDERGTLRETQKDDLGYTTQLYDMAKSLIPSELGKFSIGHVKALLILSLVNLSQEAPVAAWLLVGYASRILLSMTEDMRTFQPRFQHVSSSCYLLDFVLSSQLQLQPYLRSRDSDRVGKVPEDGIEEWQPWNACLPHKSGLARSAGDGPVRSLSTFNALVQLCAVSDAENREDTASRDLHQRFERWKTTLPSTFDYIRRSHHRTLMNPPAILLQCLTYASGLTILPSEAWYGKTCELLDRCRNDLGLSAVPPLLISILEIMRNQNLFQSLNDGIKRSLHEAYNGVVRAWSEKPLSERETNPSVGGAANISSQAFNSRMDLQMPTPESIQIPLNATQIPIGHSRNWERVERPSNRSSTLLDDLLPDMNAGVAVQNVNPIPFQGLTTPNLDTPQYSQDTTYNAPSFDPRNSVTSGDLESFFDDLASLDGADKFDNQPQFMQNLGFAPDANLTDLLASDFNQFSHVNAPYFGQPQISLGTVEGIHPFTGG